MNKKEKAKLKKTLDTYFKEIHKVYIDGDFREESFYPFLKELIEECSRFFLLKGGVGVLVQPKRTEAGIPKEVWEYRIGAYQVMEKYLKDRKRRRLSLDEIGHYMKIAKAIRLTIELQEKVDQVYGDFSFSDL